MKPYWERCQSHLTNDTFQDFLPTRFDWESFIFFMVKDLIVCHFLLVEKTLRVMAYTFIGSKNRKKSSHSSWGFCQMKKLIMIRSFQRSRSFSAGLTCWSSTLMVTDEAEEEDWFLSGPPATEREDGPGLALMSHGSEACVEHGMRSHGVHVFLLPVPFFARGVRWFWHPRLPPS